MIHRALTLVAVLALAATSTRAQPREDKPPRVALTFVGGGERASIVEERVASWFHLQPALTSDHAQTLDAQTILVAGGPAGVHAWIDISDAKQPRVFLAVREQDNGPGRYLVTSIDLPTGLDELGIELLAQIVYPSAIALWNGSLEGTRADVTAKLGEPAPPAPAVVAEAPVLESPQAQVPTVRLAVSAEYGVAMTGAGASQWAGAAFGLPQLHDGATRVGARLHMGARLPHTVTASGVELELSGVTAALDATTDRRVLPHTRVSGELGLGFDLTTYRPRQADPSLMVTDGGSALEPFVHARTGVSLTLGATTLGIEATVHVHVVRTHYDISTDMQTTPVVVPWLVQPGVSATLTW